MRWIRLAVLIPLFLFPVQWRCEADDGAVPDLFPLRVDATGTHLADSSGHPFLLHGDTAWSLIAQLTREQAEDYLADRKARGFNALLVNLVEHQFADNAPANAYGEPPFLDGKSFIGMNAAYFDHADWVLRRAEEMKFVVFLAPAYLGANGGGQGWFSAVDQAGVAALEDYGTFVASRFRDRRNIVWVHGGDYDPPDKAIIRAIASGIEKGAPGALQTVHLTRDVASADRWGDEPWLSLDTVYTYEDTYAAVRAQSARALGRPIIMIEGLYEDEHGTDAAMIRRQAYGALLAGAAGHFFGNNPLWHFDGPGLYPTQNGWREALDSPGARSISHLRHMFADLPWWLLVPGTAFPRVDVNRGYVASSSDGAFGVGYLIGTDQSQIDVRSGPRGFDIQWFDPSSGLRYPSETLPPETSVRLLPPAAVNMGGQRDWVFVMRSEP